MRKLCSKWVSHLPTIDQKQKRVDDSERCFQLFQRNKKEFLRKYVTMDETWIHTGSSTLKIASVQTLASHLTSYLSKTNKTSWTQLEKHISPRESHSHVHAHTWTSKC